MTRDMALGQGWCNSHRALWILAVASAILLSDRAQAGDPIIADSLTFHATFEGGTEARFALGVKQLHTLKVVSQTPEPKYRVTEGIDISTVAPDPDGKFGTALCFREPDESSFLFYPANKNVSYDKNGFQGSLSVWMKTDPLQIGGRYADPIQIGDKDATDSSIWVDFTKNDSPPDFRLGIFGNQKEWDITDRRGKSEEFFFRLLRIVEPPFASESWTHVVVTWEHLNSQEPGRGRLYLDGIYRGGTGAIPEKIVWDIEQTTIRLGMGPFVGCLDDLAVFSKALNSDEVSTVFSLQKGIVELY